MSIFWAVVLLGVLIFVHELGHFIFAKLMKVSVLKFSLGFGPRLLGKKIGETEYIVSAVPLGGYVKMLGEEPGEELKEEERIKAYNYQSVWKRMGIVSAGPVFNLLLAYIIFVFFLTIGLPVAIPNLNTIAPTIEDIIEGSPAMKAGLERNDTIISIDGKSITIWPEMAEIFSKNPGKELNLSVKRNNKLINIKIIPEPTKIKDEQGKEIIVGRIGISKKYDFKKIESSSIFQTPIKGLEAIYEWTALTLNILWKILSGEIATKQLGGPIAIMDAAGKAASVGILAYINFIAIISINLAILNLLPIPVLDGGHLMFLSIESIRRKPLSEEIVSVATRIGMALLLLLITFVFYNDIVRIIVPWVQKTLDP